MATYLGSSLQNFTDEVAGGYIGIDGSGNVYGTATSNTLGAGGGNSIMVFKYDTNGVLQWQRRANNTSNDAANAAAVDSSGNLYITGTTNPGAEGSYDILVAKYNSSGVLQWQRNLGETSVENACEHLIVQEMFILVGIITRLVSRVTGILWYLSIILVEFYNGNVLYRDQIMIMLVA